MLRALKILIKDERTPFHAAIKSLPYKYQKHRLILKGNIHDLS